MSSITKKALEHSLKNMLLKKPLDKITIRDLTDDCGISLHGVLLSFSGYLRPSSSGPCIEDATAALAGKKTADTWSEGLAQIFEAVYDNKPFVLNAYRSLDRERMERFLYSLTADLIRGVIDEKSQQIAASEEDKAFIADFYKYSFVGLMLDWIRRGMDDNYHEIVRKTSLVMHDAVSRALENFAAAEK